MAKKRKPPAKVNTIPLWLMGLLCIIIGPIANIVQGIIWPINPPYTNEQRGALFGRALAAALFMTCGGVMIVLHFLRRNKR